MVCGWVLSKIRNVNYIGVIERTQCLRFLNEPAINGAVENLVWTQHFDRKVAVRDVMSGL